MWITGWGQSRLTVCCVWWAAGRTVTQPLGLAGDVLQLLLLDGLLPLDSLGTRSVTRLLACLLDCQSPDRRRAFAACTLWALGQVCTCLVPG